MTNRLHSKPAIYLTISALLLCFAACNPEPTGEDRAVQEIQTDGKISSIIRSPITARGLEDTVNVAKMTFEEITYDFGEVLEGEIVEHTFKFQNTGKVPLIITEAHSTCGCTVPRWPKEPIEPGQEGEIKVTFNTLNKTSSQEKPVVITANTYPSINQVFVKGFVRKKS